MVKVFGFLTIQILRLRHRGRQHLILVLPPAMMLGWLRGQHPDVFLSN